MDNTPHDDNETIEYAPPRRRRQVVQQQYRRTQMEHRSDEHPEIPKVRRASRFAEQSTVQTPPALVEDEELEDTEEEEQRLPRRSPGPRRDTSRIMVAQRRRSPVYTPIQPPHARPRRLHNQPKRSLQIQLKYLAHNQPIIIVSVLLACILIIGTIIANAISAQQTSSSLSNTPNSGAYNGTPPTGIQQAGDPHELVITPQDTDHPAPPVFATSAYLLDADTGATLYAYNPFMHLPMMSTTKLMTALLSIELGNPDQKITITSAIDHDISQLGADSTMFGLKKGETYTLKEMLYGLLLKSGNDAAVAIADTLSGNLPNFVAKMNQRAQQLGLHDTHYMNPHGLLAPGHYSSAHDLAILGRYALSKPLIRQISGTETYIIPQTGSHSEHDLLNGNQFLFWYPGVDGGKPGWDGAENFVQVISCIRNHHHLIGVTMHTRDWWTDMRDLMNWGFDNFNWISPRDIDSEQNPIPFDSQWNYFAKDKKENTIATADQGRYYIYTGFSVSGLFLSYYDQVGGLPKLGYPKGMPAVTSASVESQRFEHGTIQCDITTNQCSTA
ncbi:MAG: hypothetical protein NVS4B7_09210 [Ktedonobacteraceae bacterium]